MNFFLRHKKTILLALADITACVISCMCVYFFLLFMTEAEFGLKISLNVHDVLVHSTLLTCCIIMGLRLCGVYANIWRYASAGDFLQCICGAVLGLGVYYVILVAAHMDFSDIFILISALLCTCAIIILRIAYTYMYAKITNSDVKNGKRTMIVGAGEACNKVVMEMGRSNRYMPIVIIDDDPTKVGRKIHGIPVGGTVSDIPKLAEKLKIKTILFAIPSCTPEEKKKILNICSETVCEVKVVPQLQDIITNGELLDQAKNINIDDLLGRDVVKFDDFSVQQLVKGKVCLVTGGGGSIGSELCRQIAKYEPKKLVIVDIYENNAYDIQQELLAKHKNLDLDVRIASVRDYDKIHELFNMFRPELVYHAAAHKHVPLMETSPEEAVKNNIAGTYNVASLANEFKVKKFVLVSTDKAVNPTNVMGATKRCCEMIVQYFSQVTKFTEFVAVRFGNVLGSNGSVIPLFEKQLASDGPLTVTHPEIIRYFMTIPEAVSLILQAGTLAHGGEIFVLDMGDPVKIVTLAENLIRLHGKEPYKDIKIEFTGLRPGEKLFEELLMSEEGLKETVNKKIFIGQQIEIDEKSFIESIERIKNIAAQNNSDDVVEELRKIVPTFNHVVLNK